MWNLYAGKNGLAIQTTAPVFMKELAKAPPRRSNERTDCIIRSLPIEPRALQIRYIDHLNMDDDSVIRDIMNFPIVFKNIGYSYENEIRFFYDMRQPLFDKLHEQFGDGFYLNNVDAKKIIEKILVSPSAEHGFFDNIKKILSNYGLDDRVEWSSLRHPPYNEVEFK